MDNKLLQKMSLRIQRAKRVLVVSHIRPDGDAVGSLLGLGLAFEAMGKETQMVLADGVPKVFRFLEGSEHIIKQPKSSYDLICTVDISDINRAGDVFEDFDQPDINIDHHITNLEFAEFNLIDPDAVSTTEILADLIPTIITPISTKIASALLTGIVTDTLGFRTQNMTPKAFRSAATLMEKGANLYEIYQRTLIRRSFEAARLWGAGLSRLEHQEGMVWTTLTLEDRESIGYPGRDDADLINILSSIDEADIALIFNEQSNGHVKVSWRARPTIDVSQIALSFGGGGHSAASGADFDGNLDEVRAIVLEKTKKILTNKRKEKVT
jgi:phosphoesterase RecJ-like protein